MQCLSLTVLHATNKVKLNLSTDVFKMPNNCEYIWLSWLQMHGTGTPLGDPIEVGALAAVFISPSAPHLTTPLVLTASKSWMGHSEPAAGFVGMMHAQLGCAQRASLAQLHLRNLNPSVAEAIRRGRGRGSLLPRQLGGTTSASRDVALRSGVSAFAFQVRVLPGMPSPCVKYQRCGE